MKKWFVACLLAMVLICAATAAMAHTRPDTGAECEADEGYYLAVGDGNYNDTQHKIRCNKCFREIWENHWTQSGATCTRKARCSRCYQQYGELKEHSWGQWKYNADGHWRSCTQCSAEEAKTPHSFSEYLKSEATCVSPAVRLRTCTDCGYQYETSSGNTNPDNHDLEGHDGKAPTCTEIGWEAYKTCKREGCNYTTYKELPVDPNNHDLVHHDAKTPTCTEIGWDEYDACTRCDYTTYVELPELGHDYQKTVVQPTCEKDGYTRYTCSRCEDTYTENPVKKLLHWYGEWSPNGDGTHSADCRREGCRHTGKVECETFEYRLLFADAEDYVFELCPVCGEVSDGARLALVIEAAAKAEHLPQGEPVLRLNELQNGEHILSVGFEYSGKLTQPTEPGEIHLPAKLLEGYALKLLDADGTETELPFTVTEDTATFTLNFDAQDEIPVRMIRLVPAS